jgi:2-polyprenyl-3-methyl-5-hydroxy-6-metoxy-1,4-benzoquinol methylase
VPIARFDREVLRCEVCGFQFIDPMYTNDDLRELYATPLYRLFLEMIQPARSPSLLEASRREFVDLGVLDLIASSPGRQTRFLDVGCGFGDDALALAGLGFDSHGLEMNEAEAAQARALGITVHNEDLASFSRRDEKYDGVLASHFIEHVQDPHLFFESIIPMLSSGGMLLVETPLASDFSGAQAERYKDIYHTLFWDHFTLVLAGAVHNLEVVTTRNLTPVVADSSFTLNIQMRFQRMTRPLTAQNEALRNGDYAQIRLARRAYDGLAVDAVKWTRSHQALRSAPICGALSRAERRAAWAARKGRRIIAKVKRRFLP